jgi:hypothetical protein
MGSSGGVDHHGGCRGSAAKAIGWAIVGPLGGAAVWVAVTASRVGR